jgi:FkbH-like protein
MKDLKYSEIIKQNSHLSNNVQNLPPYRITILSNFTCKQLDPILTYQLRAMKINPIIKIGNYDNIVQDSYDCLGDDLVLINYDLVGILSKHSVFFEDFNQNEIDRLYDSITSDVDLILNNLRQIPAVVFNSFSGLVTYANSVIPSKASVFANKLNQYLYSKKETNVNIVDINVIVAKVGLYASYDARMFCLSKTLYTIAFWKEYVCELSVIVSKNTGNLKKAIIFDCDNTLWKGILGEDGMSDIDMAADSKTGQIFQKVQQIAVWLSKQGVIVGLCSKNNPGDVDNVLSNHPDMVLKLEHIVISKVNWVDKATNLREISEELNIGLNSLVFIDDSSFEINLIREQVPEILSYQVPKNLEEYPNQLLSIIQRNFYLSGNKDDLDKTKQYKSQSDRENEKSKHRSIEDYLLSIGIEISIDEDDGSQIPRISQLTQKTNQFNLTTKRYTENQIKDFIEDENYKIFSIKVQDKFGDSGLTAVLIINQKDAMVNIDTFVLSCRIMGRDIEKAIMNFIVNYYSALGFDEICSAYFPTVKNKPVLRFYENLGFTILNEDQGNKYYNINLTDYVYQNVNYVKINNYG